jgi:hypothetical protein
MKTVFFYLALVFTLAVIEADGQGRGIENCLEQLPVSLELDNSRIRTYKVVTDYLDYNLKGHFLRKTRVGGTYTCGLPGDTVKWNDVYIARSSDVEAPFPEGEQQKYMENFSYTEDGKILSEDFFKGIPQAGFLEKNLIWDIAGLHWFAYWHWDKLELNSPFRDQDINNKELDLSGAGTFQNRNVELTWIGITKINEEMCAIIKYSTMNNPVSVKMENMTMQGRSHYWGEVYVSLADKEIELANLTEDVVTDITMKGQPENILGYTVRKIMLSKVQ